MPDQILPIYINKSRVFAQHPHLLLSRSCAGAQLNTSCLMNLDISINDPAHPGTLLAQPTHLPCSEH